MFEVFSTSYFKQTLSRISFLLLKIRFLCSIVYFPDKPELTALCPERRQSLRFVRLERSLVSAATAYRCLNKSWYAAAYYRPHFARRWKAGTADHALKYTGDAVSEWWS